MDEVRQDQALFLRVFLTRLTHSKTGEERHLVAKDLHCTAIRSSERVPLSSGDDVLKDLDDNDDGGDDRGGSGCD